MTSEYGYLFPISIPIATLEQVFAIALFTAAGVLSGAQLGPKLQHRGNPDVLRVAIAVTFLVLGLFMLWTLLS